MKRITFFLTFVAICCCLIACKTDKKQSETSTVHLKGQFVNIGKDFVRMSYNGASSLLGDSRDIMLRLDPNGNVDTILILTEPTYFNIARNTIYLTPGDDLTFKISDVNTDAEFQGKGAEANNYMKNRLFSKSGSFLNAGKNIREDLASTIRVVDSLAEVRMHQLETLINVSDEFKKLEEARIKADVINSYIYYANYSKLFAGVAKREEMLAIWNDFTTSIAPDIIPKIQEIMNEEFLDVAVVRDVIAQHQDSVLNEKWFEGITFPQRTQELFTSAEIINELRMSSSEDVLDKAERFLQTVGNKDFAVEIELKIAQNMKLLPGQPAIDIELTDVAGNTRKLSDFKGKLIYVDLWATWCGPCLQEAPFFEKISKQYLGKDIVFIPVSTDRARAPWLTFLQEHKKELEQFHSADLALKADWLLYGIPRFILIDKEFNIIDAFASRPSDKATTELIDSLLSK